MAPYIEWNSLLLGCSCMVKGISSFDSKRVQTSCSLLTHNIGLAVQHVASHKWNILKTQVLVCLQPLLQVAMISRVALTFSLLAATLAAKLGAESGALQQDLHGSPSLRLSRSPNLLPLKGLIPLASPAGQRVHIPNI